MELPALSTGNLIAIPAALEPISSHTPLLVLSSARLHFMGILAPHFDSFGHIDPAGVRGKRDQYLRVS